MNIIMDTLDEPDSSDWIVGYVGRVRYYATVARALHDVATQVEQVS